jgi:glyoxylase-like metal-dependent hydrolase (beta-lactamase superfamily II)
MKSKNLFAAAFVVAFLLNQQMMAQTVSTIEQDGLKMHVFLSEPILFEVASVVLEGEHEAALIDAQFSANNADRVAELIRSTGKKLTTIFISYSDPDYYFGLDRIARQFPEAEIYATPQTVWLIEATKEEKTAIWSPQLGANAPEKIRVPTAIAADHFMLENRRVEIRQTAGDEQHAFLWIPSVRAILGGNYLSEGEHLWVADSQTKEARSQWLTGLDAMEKRAPAIVIPAHFISGKRDFRNDVPIRFTRDYLTALEAALIGVTGSAEVIQRMKTAWPNLAGEPSLEMTARVLTGEMPWKTHSAFPAIGRKAEVNFGGEYIFELNFPNERQMSFQSLVQRTEGRPMTDTVHYTAVEVAPKVYMVYWTEKDNTHVVHIEDFGQGVVYTNIVAPDGSFTNLKGTLRLLP